MRISCTGEFVQYHLQEYHSLDKDGLHSHTARSNFEGISIDDVMADDWIIITYGIKKEFSKYEGGMEYQDDTDWDNYVPTKGVWGLDD